MKRLALLLLCAASLTASAQNRNVTFIHGLTGGYNSWAVADAYFESLFPINTKRIAYNSDQPISAIADEQYGALLPNTVVVAHSLGGLVAREMYRDHPGGEIESMVLVGVPHLGSNAALALDSGAAAAMIGLWVSDLMAGPIALGLGAGLAADLAHAYLSYIAGNLAEGFLEEVFDVASTQDLKPGSAFLQTLNSAPTATLPTAYYTLWSTEDWNMPFRLWDTRTDDVEDGSVMRAVGVVQGIYLQVAYLSGQIAGYYYNGCYYEGDLGSCAAWTYWANVSGAFMHGVYTLAYFMQWDWNYYIMGTDIDARDSDGIVHESSQHPSWVPNGKQIEILGDINHLEQRTHQNALDAIKQALTAGDIDIDATPPSPLSVAILGPSSLNSGQTGTWTAGVSGGETPYSYLWEYQLLCNGGLAPDGDGARGGRDNPGPLDVACDVWHTGGTAASYSRSVNGEQFDLWLRLSVTDAVGQKKTIYKTVRIN